MSEWIADIEAAVMAMMEPTGLPVAHLRPIQQTTFPCVTVQLISDPTYGSHSGPAGFARAIVQIDVWAIDKADMGGAAQKVRWALTAGVFAGLQLTPPRIISERSGFDADPKYRKRSFDVEVFHTQPRHELEVILA